MTLSTLPVSQAVKTPRVSACEPLCARFWAGVALCTRRGNIQPARGKFRDGIKTANKPPRPAGVQRFNGMKRTPRVVIPPPHIEAPKKCKTGVFITSHSRALAETQRSGFGGKRTSDRESESCRLRRDEGFVVRSDDGPASHLSGLRRSRCPAKCTGRGMAPHPIFGQKPGPT